MAASTCFWIRLYKICIPIEYNKAVGTGQIKYPSYFPRNNKGNAPKGSVTHHAWSDQPLLLCIYDHAVANPAQIQHADTKFKVEILK